MVLYFIVHREEKKFLVKDINILSPLIKLLITPFFKYLSYFLHTIVDFLKVFFFFSLVTTLEFFNQVSVVHVEHIPLIRRQKLTLNQPIKSLTQYQNVTILQIELDKSIIDITVWL